MTFDWWKLAQDLAPWAIPAAFTALLGLWTRLRRAWASLHRLEAGFLALARRNRLTLDVARLTLYHIENRAVLNPTQMRQLRDKVDDLRDEFWEMEGNQSKRPERTLMEDATALRAVLRKGPRAEG